MRTALATTLLGTLIIGCMAPLEAEDLVFAEDEELALQDMRTIPDGQRPAQDLEISTPAPEPEPGPASTTPTSDQPRLSLLPQAEGCPWLRAEGFPAISADGTTVVVPYAEHLQLSYDPGSMELQWHDVALGTVQRTDPVVTGELNQDDDGQCNPAELRRLERRVDQLERELATQRWRAMEVLPVEYFDPDTHMIEYYKDTVPMADRGVQVVVQHGEIIVRIAGAKVLERHPLSPGMLGMPYEVYGDRETGTVVVVTMDCIGDSCTCDPGFTAQVVHWQPETFETIDRRACLVERGDEYCEPIDFGVSGTAWSM
ncbi:MAG: hypothetical protein AB1Z98_39860 [Nannocystaceae bacterium]